jgi:hypothetical protein
LIESDSFFSLDPEKVLDPLGGEAEENLSLEAFDVVASFETTGRPLSRLLDLTRARAIPLSRAASADTNPLGGGEGYSILTSFLQ